MTPPVQRRIIQVIADAFTFVRSVEANRAISAVTLDQLIQDQILRNGESTDSRSSQYDPYSFDPSVPKPAGSSPISLGVFAGGSDTNAPTKSARLLGLKNNLKAAIAELKKIPPQDLKDASDQEEASLSPVLESLDDVERSSG